MTADKTKAVPNVSRQKIVIGVFAVIIIFFLWQLRGMFGGSTPAPAPQAAKTPPTLGQRNALPLQQNGAPQQPSPSAQPVAPQQGAPLPITPPMTPREAELIRLQQETEAKYIAALNELQVLKIDREIAETNKAIASAKLDTVTAQKSIVDLLTQPTMPKNPYAQNLLGPGGMAIPTGQPAAPGAPIAVPITKEVSYTVISVTELQYRWGAVLSSEGNLYSVHVGDVYRPMVRKSSSSTNQAWYWKRRSEKKISMMPVI